MSETLTIDLQTGSAKQFAGQVGHELKNLLAGIQGYSELLLLHLDSGNDEAVRRDAKRIRSIADQADSFAKELLILGHE